MTAAQVTRAAAYLRGIRPEPPRVAVVLGSGLGRFAESLEDARPIGYEEIPDFPRTSVAGHAGRLVLGRLGKARVVAMQGRLHLYEGLPAEAVTFGIRTFHALGVGTVLLTTASGGINRNFRAGDLMIIEDQLNFQFRMPPLEVLRTAAPAGALACRSGRVYSPRLVRVAERVAASLGLTNVHRGVFAGMLGPTYETPAEIRMVGKLGADAVSMSVILESLTAHALGLEVAGLSAIVNVAAGLLDVPLNHEEVLEGARAMEPLMVAYLKALVPELAAEES